MKHDHPIIRSPCEDDCRYLGGMSYDILGQDRSERAGITDLFRCGRPKIILDVVVPQTLIRTDQI